MNIFQLIFLLVATNAGGEGKTMIALVMEALWKLLNQPVELLDGDVGNHALKSTREDARTVGWGAKEAVIPQMLHLTQGCHSILDLGANTLASAREVVDLIPALELAYVQRGYRSIAFLPVSTNKAGAVGAIKDLESNILNFEKFFVEVDRDGSGNFDGELNRPNVIALGHLEPGFISAIRQHSSCIASFIMSPPREYELAARHVADWLRRFAIQPIVCEVLGGVPSVLTSYPAPDEYRFAVKRASQATNDALLENARCSRILDAIGTTGWNATGLRNVAMQIDRGLL